MVKLTYSKEMEKQDKLWNTAKEDLEIMKKLYQQIMEEAIKYGYKGKYAIYDCGNEAICEIFDSEEEREENYISGKDTVFGYCKPLICCLEKDYLN